jgi:Amt family ammonium transporter
MEQIRVDRFVVLTFLVLIFASTVSAQAPVQSVTATDGNSRLAALEQQVADAKGSADNAWMLTSSALVLMMTGPGLALFYGGLVRKKNVLATMMQSIALMALISILWALFGYSLAFGSETVSCATCTTYSCVESEFSQMWLTLRRFPSRHS